jgi:chromosome segregation ATPase
MGTNGIDIGNELRLQEEVLRAQKAEHLRSRGEAGPPESSQEFALAPLVDKIAYSIAKGLVVAVKELEEHIAAETRKVGESVDRRLDTLQASLHELTAFVGDQRATNGEVQGQLQQLSAGLHEADTRQTSKLETLHAETKAFSTSVGQRFEAAQAAHQESEARHAAELGALQRETRAFSESVSERIDGICRDLGIQQEDIAALKTTLCTFSARVDTLVERLDRQAEAVRSMCAAYSQRETELEQLVDGLARLRAYPTPMPANKL